MLHGAKNTTTTTKATTIISIMNCSFLCNFILCFLLLFAFFLAFFWPSPSPRGFNLDKQTSHTKSAATTTQMGLTVSSCCCCCCCCTGRHRVLFIWPDTPLSRRCRHRPLLAVLCARRQLNTFCAF